MSWGIVATVGSTIIGSAISSSAAEDAEDAQYAATQDAKAEQRRQYDITREDFRPYRQEGVNALHKLSDEIGRPMNADEVTADPGYQFGMDQGQQALDRKIAAMGGRVSGAALKAAARFGTNYAASGFNAAYQRRQDRMNRLAALAGVGQTATGSSAAAGANATNAITGLIERQGDAAGASRMAQGSIWADAGNQLAGMYRRPSGGAGGQGLDQGVNGFF